MLVHAFSLISCLAVICFLQVLQAVLNMYSTPEHLFTEVCVIVDKVCPNSAIDLPSVHC